MLTFNARTISLLAAAVLLSGMPAFVQADMDKDKGMRRGGGHSDMERSGHNFVGVIFHSLIMKGKDLGLSDDQTNKLKTMKSDYEKAKIKGGADLKLAEVDVQNLSHDEKADMSAIEAAVRKSETAHANLRLEGIKTIRAAFAVLTPEQKEKMRSMKSMRHGEGKDDYDKDKGGHEAPKGGAKP